MLTEEQYNTLLSSDVKHYKVLFEIAKHEFCRNNIKQAKQYIDEALLNIENSRLADANDSLEVFWIIGNKKIKKSHVFQMAGLLYSPDSPQKAAEYYKAFQYNLQKEFIEAKCHDFQDDNCFLYSFRKYNEHSIEDLVNNTITFVHPSEMNDPNDTAIISWCKESHLAQWCNRQTSHISFFEKSFEPYRIRSFVIDTEKAKAYKNILMWSHYADRHKGFCVKYNFSRDYIFHYDDEHQSSRAYLPVVYQPDNLFLDRENLTFMDGFMRKAPVWQYENEVRLLSYNPSEKSHFVSEPLDKKSSIEEIIFGALCPPKTKETIKGIFTSSKVLFSEMYIDNADNIFDLKKREI